MLSFVLKMITNSGASHPVVVWPTVFMPAVGKPDGFKGLRDFDLNAKLGWELLFIPPCHIWLSYEPFLKLHSGALNSHAWRKKNIISHFNFFLEAVT